MLQLTKYKTSLQTKNVVISQYSYTLQVYDLLLLKSFNMTSKMTSHRTSVKVLDPAALLRAALQL